MNKNFRKDTFRFGLLLGIALTILTLVLLYGVYYLFLHQFEILMVRDKSFLVLLSIIPPLIVFRYYMVKLKFDKSGKGLLVISFVVMVIYFAKDYLPF